MSTTMTATVIIAEALIHTYKPPRSHALASMLMKLSSFPC